MWARNLEMMLGFWLLLSPFIFRHPPESQGLWWNDMLCGLATAAFSLLAYYSPLRGAPRMTAAVAVWLIFFGFTQASPPVPPAFQNDVTVGLLLLMFVIIPNEANLPPRAWRRQMKDNR